MTKISFELRGARQGNIFRVQQRSRIHQHANAILRGITSRDVDDIEILELYLWLASGQEWRIVGARPPIMLSISYKDRCV
jgi:hypothetical protein